MSFMRKGCLVTVAAVLLLVGGPLLWRGFVRTHYRSAIYPQAETPNRPVAIVFGAAVYRSGRLSPVLRDRVDTAIDLYHSGQVDRLIMSGSPINGNYDEPGAMRDYAIERGVAPTDIVTDHGGRRTYDTCYRARHVFDVREAVLVTQAFHLPRALLTCDGLGVGAIGVAADRQSYRGARWYEMRETAATLVATWDVFRRQPPPLVESAERPTGWAAQLAGDN
jgi:SanA protein